MDTPRNDNARVEAGTVSIASNTSNLESNLRIYPRASAVKGAVLADLLSGRAITHKDCWIEHGSSRLAHHIMMLRAAGWPIEMREIQVTTSDGRVAEIGEYRLDHTVIAEEAEVAQDYISQVRNACLAKSIARAA